MLTLVANSYGMKLESGEVGPNPTLMLVANSCGLELQGSEV
jgi:hypothetical protein